MKSTYRKLIWVQGYFRNVPVGISNDGEGYTEDEIEDGFAMQRQKVRRHRRMVKVKSLER